MLNVTSPAVWVNSGTAPNVAVPPRVNEPEVNTKLVDGFIVPLDKERVFPLFVNVVQERVPVPEMSKLPPFHVNVLEQVSV